MNLQKYNEAIERYNKAIEINPDYMNWYNKGFALYHLFEEAVERYNKGIEVDPNDHKLTSEAHHRIKAGMSNISRDQKIDRFYQHKSQEK